ncbi:hypothetical protein LPJ61_001511 [Coemansia biformis]|uniref:Uncharacterized protein n=1 Tax=Coemansia biformis TaxID=1286918 RepID=A0A9W7Y9W0_9FUNG|nr:hypothetical protein LPJ61_001511 [Coemansia biformis]
MVPAAKQRSFRFEDESSGELNDAGDSNTDAFRSHMSALLGGVASGAQRALVMVTNCNIEPVISGCAGIGNISVFNCRWGANYKSTLGVIHANAESLRQLGITFDTLDNFEEVMISEAGRHYTYSNLSKLVLDEGYSSFD